MHVVRATGLRKFLKFSVHNGVFSVIKLTTFHQKWCHACLKSGGCTVPPLRKVGGSHPPPPHTYPPYSTPMVTLLGLHVARYQRSLACPCIQLVTKTKKMFVGGLSASTTIEDVRSYFEQFGKVSFRSAERHRCLRNVSDRDSAINHRIYRFIQPQEAQLITFTDVSEFELE